EPAVRPRLQSRMRRRETEPITSGHPCVELTLAPGPQECSGEHAPLVPPRDEFIGPYVKRIEDRSHGLLVVEYIPEGKISAHRGVWVHHTETFSPSSS